MRDSAIERFNAEFDRAVVLPFKRKAPPVRANSRGCSLARIFQAALTYFALVFGTGFLLGTIRVLWVIPNLGERNAELLEAPLMLFAVVLAARWIVRGNGAPLSPVTNLAVGLIALTLLVVAELLLVSQFQSLSISEYVRGRDPISGSVYLLLLGVFGLMPWLLSRRRRAPVRRIGLAC